jgi:hypothetical protein
MSAEKYFALRLAHKLGEPAAAQHYADLLERYTEGQLLVAYHRAKKVGSHLDPARSFHVELQRLAGHRCDSPPSRRLAAIRVARRSIAVVVLSGTHLQYPAMTRELSSSSHKALGSAVRFVNTILEQCPFPTAAIESREDDDDGRRSLLAQTIEQALAEQNVGIWNVAKADVLASFGHPPLRFRNHVRDAVSNTLLSG